MMIILDIFGFSKSLPAFFSFNNMFDIVGSMVTMVEDITFLLVAIVIVPRLFALFTVSGN